MRRRLVATLSLAALLFPCVLAAETRFVRGGSDGINVYAVILRNGVEFRTDEIGYRFNQHIWSELPAADRKALIKAYGWNMGHRVDDFGKATSDEMADWINQEQGWTALVDALKARRAARTFPTLVPLFGAGATLEIPDYACVNAEVINSGDYKEAARLATEIRLDYDLGKAIYDMLVNAKWDQVGVAVKAISEGLIKLIVDNFMTGLVTKGASRTSELAAKLAEIEDELRDILYGRMAPGAPPPTAPELIARIETAIGEMEAEAEAAAAKVVQKKNRLSQLATTLKQRDAERTQAKKDDAKAVRDALKARTATIPPPATPPTLVPSNPNATPDQQQIDIRDQASAWLFLNVRMPLNELESAKSAAVGAVVGAYDSIVSGGRGIISYPGGGYLAGASDGFSRPYFEIMERVANVEPWIGSGLPNARTVLQAAAGKLSNAPADVKAVLDAEAPQIDLLDARNRGMDAYADVLGYRPSETTANEFSSLRDYSSLIDIAATTELKAEDLAAEYRDHDSLAEALQNTLPTGVAKRRQWIASEASKYEDLRFNWENSVSYVIATLRQIDRLHSGPYFKLDASQTCYTLLSDGQYSSLCLDTYSVDVAGIRAAIAAKPTAEARERARMDAVRELVRLRNEENRLLQKLEMSQSSHVNDRTDLHNFFGALYARCDPPTEALALAEFSAAGHPIQTEATLFANLVPDITYYMFDDMAGDQNALLKTWVRERSDLQTNVQQAIELVSGKIPEYYDLLNLYQIMDVDEIRLLSMSEPEFDAFMTDTSVKILGYWAAFDTAEVSGEPWPSWRLIANTQRRQNDLLSAYYRYAPTPPSAWDIDGTVSTSGGIGVPGIDVLLTGQLTTSTKTDSNGRFRFAGLGSGGFTVSVSGGNYQFDAPSQIVTVASSSVTANFTAGETPGSGYSVIGRVTDTNGAGVGAVGVALTSSSGEQLQTTAADGRYRFIGIGEGESQVRPVSDVLLFTPAARTITLIGSVSGIDFQAAAGTSDGRGLSVTVTGTGSGTVTSTQPGINCPPDCWASYPKDTVVGLAATPGSESAFAGWYGRCSGMGVCSVTMDDVSSVSAAFSSTAPVDTAPPSITTFSVPATSTSPVPLTFAAADNVGVTGYLVATDTAQPLPGDGRWTATPPANVVFSRAGVATLYGWAKDRAGNMAVSNPAVVQVTVNAFDGATPTGVVASASSSSSVAISWLPVSGATAYVVERRAPGAGYQVIASVGNYWHTDTNASAGTAYLYRVRASGEGRVSTSSLPDLAMTVVFEDSPLVAGALIRAVHLSQLRTAIAAVRQLADLAPFSFTGGATAGQPIRAVHLEELRVALNQARNLFGLSTSGYTDPSLSGASVKAVHIQQLRDAMR